MKWLSKKRTRRCWETIARSELRIAVENNVEFVVNLGCVHGVGVGWKECSFVLSLS